MKTTSDKIMENIAAWDETPEGKSFRDANDIRKPAPAQVEESPSGRPQHSPLPWHVSHQLSDGYSIAREIAPNCGRLLHIATIHPANSWGEKISIGEAKANAAFIVRACNNAQRLADALNGMMGAFCRNVEQTVANEGENALQSDVREAREALAQWEGANSNE